MPMRRMSCGVSHRRATGSSARANDITFVPTWAGFIYLAVVLDAVGGRSAFAVDADGTITQIDVDARTITLEDGNTYLLPGEFDPANIKEGSSIFFIYQVVDGVNVITDMEIDE